MMIKDSYSVDGRHKQVIDSYKNQDDELPENSEYQSIEDEEEIIKTIMKGCQVCTFSQLQLEEAC